MIRRCRSRERLTLVHALSGLFLYPDRLQWPVALAALIDRPRSQEQGGQNGNR